MPGRRAPSGPFLLGRTEVRPPPGLFAQTSEPLTMPVRARIVGSDVGSRVQDSSPRMARVANEDVLGAGGVITGLTASHAPMGRYNHQRRVHRGTNNSGVLRSLDQALIG